MTPLSLLPDRWFDDHGWITKGNLRFGPTLFAVFIGLPVSALSIQTGKEIVMTAGEYCNREVIVADLNLSIIEASKLFRRHHVGCLVATEQHNGKTLPRGIITDRDLVIEVMALDIDPKTLDIKDIISNKPVTILENETLLNTLEVMQKKKVRRILVVDDEGQLLGLLTADDAIELIAEAMNNLTRLVKGEIEREHKLRP